MTCICMNVRLYVCVVCMFVCMNVASFVCKIYILGKGLSFGLELCYFPHMYSWRNTRRTATVSGVQGYHGTYGLRQREA